jgi:hypothetical protein
VVQPFRIIRPPLQINGQLPARVFVLAASQVGRARLAMDFAQVVLFILLQHGLKVRQGIVQPSLFARHASQLEMSVGLGGIDGHGRYESLGGLGILTALLVDQSELILSVRVVRIHGRRLQHAAEILSAAQPGAHISELAAEIIKRVKEKKGRGEPPQNEPERPPNHDSAGKRNHGQTYRDGGHAVFGSKHRSHGEEHQHRKVEVRQHRNGAQHRKRNHPGDQRERYIYRRPGHRSAGEQ